MYDVCILHNRMDLSSILLRETIYEAWVSRGTGLGLVQKSSIRNMRSWMFLALRTKLGFRTDNWDLGICKGRVPNRKHHEFDVIKPQYEKQCRKANTMYIVKDCGISKLELTVGHESIAVHVKFWTGTKACDSLFIYQFTALSRQRMRLRQSNRYTMPYLWLEGPKLN